MRKTSPTEIKHHLYRNLVVLLIGILLAIVLVRLGFVDALLTLVGDWKLLAAFVAGIFFTSVLTVGTAAVTLASLAPDVGLWPLAALGALGAVVGDSILFSFVKDRIADDFAALVENSNHKSWRHIVKLAFWHRLLPILGFLVIASPLPDEIGLAIMGVSKLGSRTFVLLSFTANFVGIAIIGLVTLGYN